MTNRDRAFGAFVLGVAATSGAAGAIAACVYFKTPALFPVALIMLVLGMCAAINWGERP